MENYLFLNNSRNLEKSNNQGINVFNKFKKKKKKYIACNYNWKEFCSDDEDNSYYNYSLYDNNAKTNKSIKKRKFSQDTVCLHKNKLHKASTNKGFKEENKSSESLSKTKISNKKVRFSDVKYIDVESFKKYNTSNTNYDPFFEGIYYNNLKEKKMLDDKADVKCTCFIY